MGKGPASEQSKSPLTDDVAVTARNAHIFQKEFINFRGVSGKKKTKKTNQTDSEKEN